MVTLTLDPVATAKYGTKSVGIKVSDSTDAYVKDLMMSHNRAPLSGGAASPVVAPLGTQGLLATKTVAIKTGAHTIGETIDPNVHFVDDEELTYYAVPAAVTDNYKLILTPVLAVGVKITGVQSTWNGEAHVPVDVLIGATDSGGLEVLDKNG